MKTLFLAAGVAALAISMPATAQGGGKGNNKGQAVKAERGGGAKARASSDRRGGGQKRLAARQGQGGGKAKRAERRAEARPDKRGNRGQAKLENRGNRSQARNERRNEQRSVAREQRNQQRVAARGRDWNDQRIELRRGDRDIDRDRFDRRFASRGLPASFSCPPGHRVAPMTCMPPGQYKKLEGQRLTAALRAQALPKGLRSYYRDNDDYYWRFSNGYAYRVDRDDQLIRSVLPLIGAGLGIGMPFPYTSANYRVPSGYQPFYQNTSDDYYRYANGYVYEIDRDTGLIEDMIPLLDQGYGVGQMLPASYSYYNLPHQYRSHYRDDDDYMYRYAPGAIYQVDRETQLITSVVSLLTGTNTGLAIGQPLPMGYDAYNVPYAYRDRYYDTPDSLYRYSNRQIYQIDPTTRLITAIVDAIV